MEQASITKPISRTVVERVAAAEDVDPVDIPVPLFDVIDPDALDSLFTSTTPRSNDGGQISFTYFGYHVTVSSDGDVSVADAEAVAGTGR